MQALTWPRMGPITMRIRTDKRYSAQADYRWFRRCGLPRRQAYAMVMARYGWR